MNDRSAIALGTSRPLCSAHHAPLVVVVDDDLSIRESLDGVIRSSGWRAQTFATAGEFLSHPRTEPPSCLILDVTLPDLTGLELQTMMTAERATLPIIFITGLHDVPMTVQAMKAGAHEFLTKPFATPVLLDAVRSAIEHGQARRADESRRQALRQRHATLTHREREVMALVVRGKLNKQVGADLGISEITVKAHRGRAMAKMQARSLAEWVRMADFI